MKIAILILVLAAPPAFAWGRRGHQIVGETAAQLVGNDPSARFLRNHSYDFGYYSNVPDFIWKRPETYETEKPNHFMDLEIFERVFEKRPEVKEPYELERLEFEKTYPEIPLSAGRAYWRIRELADSVETLSQSLRALEGDTSKEASDQRRRIQEKWMVTAGTLSHYVGDLSMPLHVSENYDGKMTGQPGLHSYFEDNCVDELYPALAATVYNDAKTQWPAFTKKNATKPVLAMIRELTAGSVAAIPQLLKLDKQIGRKDQTKSAKVFHDLIQKRLVASTLVLAEIYRRGTVGWSFDDNKFYFYAGEPAYLPPPSVTAVKK